MSVDVQLPNPFDLEGPWITVATGEYEEMQTWVEKTFGADGAGRIQIMTDDNEPYPDGG